MLTASAIPNDFGPFSTAINVALDLAGKPDAVNGGTSDFYATRIQFHPPAGYRTRILHAYGDFIAWPRVGPVPSGTSAEIGYGLKTTAPDGDTRVTYPGYTATPYRNSFLWVQGILTPEASGMRIPIDSDVRVGGLLEPDNILISQTFVALNTTGLTIHMEPTIVVVYQWEKEREFLQ